MPNTGKYSPQFLLLLVCHYQLITIKEVSKELIFGGGKARKK